MNSQQIDEFLEEVYRRGETSRGLDIIYNTVFDLQDGLEEKFFNDNMEMFGGPRILPENPNTPKPKVEVITEILQKVDVNRATITQLLGFLVTTKGLKNQLPERTSFVEKIKWRLKKEKRDVKALIGGLE